MKTIILKVSDKIIYESNTCLFFRDGTFHNLDRYPIERNYILDHKEKVVLYKFPDEGFNAYRTFYGYEDKDKKLYELLLKVMCKCPICECICDK